jgi:hypothetical protein
MRYWVLALFAFVVLSGCVRSNANKALLQLPATERVNIRNVACTNCTPDIGFEPLGMDVANRYAAHAGIVGSFVGAAVTTSLERSSDVLRSERAAAAQIAARLLNEKSEQMLARHGLTNGVIPSGSIFSIHLQLAGLREVERKHFAAFGVAKAQLNDPRGKTIWAAYAESIYPDGRPLEDFTKQPELYRRHFEEVTQDLAHQLIEGPIRDRTR